MRRSPSSLRVLAGLAAVVTLAACATHAPPPPQVVAPEPAAEPAVASTTTSAAIEQLPAPREDGRLPSTAQPRRYALALEVDPTRERFRGEATIDVDLAAATSHVVLHGRSLNVTEVTATTGSTALAGTATPRLSHGGVTPEEIVLGFPSPLPAGHVVLSITYDAPFDRELSGLYRVKEGERWYAFTQFETTAARRAFPCFDEPGYKVPFDVRITTPNGMIAVANTPELAHAGATAASTRFDFATTPPLPTYLLAFAVGDFDVREGARTPVPIRLVTVKGKTGLGSGALDATAGLVKKLGDYFALPYPFAKLDVVAVPDFAAGAMENPGLVTFREELVLFDPARPSVQGKRDEALVIAHELAHMWFGDLVTMKWWNDVWLNEGFATWMETRATDAWHPDYAERLDAVAEGLRVMDTDALTSARAVRQPVTSTSEIEEAFDGISYQKAAAVLGMIERWIGPEAMQRGVRDYVRAHAWKSAEAADLLGALDRASGRDVSGMAATFLDRPGVPGVAVASKCDGGKLSFTFTQSAWRPLGVEPRGTDAPPWRVPVCVHPANAATDPCTELTGARGSLEVPAASPPGACAPWTLPNAGQAGYYRVSLPEGDIRALVRGLGEIDVAGRIGLVSNLWAQVRAGTLAPDVLLDVLPAFDRETDSHVVQAVVATLAGFDHALVDDTSRMAFRTYVATRLWRAKQRLGWEAKDGEADDVALARTAVLQGMGWLAREPVTVREAATIAASWLKDPASVSPDVAAIAVPLGSMHAGPARLEELRAVVRSAKTPADRITAVTAMGTFSDRAILERAWDLALTDELRQQDASRLFRIATLRTERARAFFPWLQAHWNAARAKAPAGYQQGLVDVASAACTKEDLDAWTAYLEPRAKELEGAVRPLAENAEEATACTALRAHGAEAVAKYFQKSEKR